MPVKLLIALIPMLVASTNAAGESFRFQGRVDVVPAPSPVASSQEIRAACTLGNQQIGSASPQITGTQQADPSANPSENRSSSPCVVTVVYD